MQKGPCFRKKICTPSIARRETHYITALDRVTKKKEKPWLFLLFCDWGGSAALFYWGTSPDPSAVGRPAKAGFIPAPPAP